MLSTDTPQPVHANAWHGRLQLTYAPVEGKTQLLQQRSQAPLKVQRSFYPEGPVCHNAILHTAGGVVGGDRLSLDLRLEPQAHALITTAAAGKIYRTNGQTAEQVVQVSLGEAACLEWLPQETIVFEQARYRQTMRIDLAPGAIWLGWEITRFGRSARGEQFLAGDWRSHTEVWQQGCPLWIDRQWVPGSPEVFHSPHGLAGYPVVGSFALVGYAVDADWVAQVRSPWAAPAEVMASRGEIGITRLQAGLLCRYRGHSSTEARQWFTQVWQQVRSTVLGRSISLPRVWGV